MCAWMTRLWARHLNAKSLHCDLDLWANSMNLEHMTHHVMIMICGNLFQKPTLLYEVIGLTWKCSVCTVTLSFELPWMAFERETQNAILIICDKLFQNLVMHDKDMGQPQKFPPIVHCVLDLWASIMILKHETSSCYGDHECEIILKF